MIGGVWASSNNALEYGYISKGYELVSYKYCKGSWIKASFLGLTYKASFSDNYEEVTDVEIGKNDLDQTAVTDIFQGLDFSNFSFSQYFTDNIVYNTGIKNSANGYQVRCIVE